MQSIILRNIHSIIWLLANSSPQAVTALREVSTSDKGSGHNVHMYRLAVKVFFIGG